MLAVVISSGPLLLRNAPFNQAVMFADDVTVSKTMVKYACGIPKESIVDVEAIVAVPENPVESCSQKQVGTRGAKLGMAQPDPIFFAT